jgi:peptidoglycan hydrolase-like protein with peptidoglycan-binding domain
LNNDNDAMNKTSFKFITGIIIAILFFAPLFTFAQASPTLPAPSYSLLAAVSSLESGLTSLYKSVTSFITPTLNSSSSATSTAATASGDTLLTLEMGSRGVLVSSLQRALIKEGYLKETPTGVFDANTEAALEAMQKAKKVSVTGQIVMTAKSLPASFAYAAPVFTNIAKGTTGAEATAIQKFFIGNGYLKITAPTGYFGSVTQAAVEAFQKAHGLPQTGVIDPVTFKAMNGE